MLVVTTENVAGHRVTEVKGQCFGVVVRSRGLGGNIMAGLRSIVGGEIDEYTQLLEEARRHAVDRLVRNATAMGANAVLMMRFNSAEIGQTMSEIVAYGTAAVIEREAGVSRSVLRAASIRRMRHPVGCSGVVGDRRLHSRRDFAPCRPGPRSAVWARRRALAIQAGDSPPPRTRLGPDKRALYRPGERRNWSPYFINPRPASGVTWPADQESYRCNRSRWRRCAPRLITPRPDRFI